MLAVHRDLLIVNGQHNILSCPAKLCVQIGGPNEVVQSRRECRLLLAVWSLRRCPPSSVLHALGQSGPDLLTETVARVFDKRWPETLPVVRFEFVLAKKCPRIRDDFHEPATDQIKAVGRLAFFEDDAASREINEFDTLTNLVEFSVRQVCKDRQSSHVTIEHSRSINVVELLLVLRIVVQHVEHVAQHFQHVAVLIRNDCCRARSPVHAAHFTEEFAFVKWRLLRHPVNVGRTIDRNKRRSLRTL